MLVYRKVIYYITLEPHSTRAYHTAELSWICFQKKIDKEANYKRVSIVAMCLIRKTDTSK